MATFEIDDPECEMVKVGTLEPMARGDIYISRDLLLRMSDDDLRREIRRLIEGATKSARTPLLPAEDRLY